MRDAVLEHGPAVRRVLLLVITAGVPLFFLRFTHEPFTIPKFVLLTTALSLVVGIRVVEIVQGAPWRGLDRLALPAVVFSFPLLLSWVLTDHKLWSLFGWYPRFLGLVPYLVVVLYGVLVADAFAGRAHQLAWAYALTGAVLGFYGLLQLVQADPFTWNMAGGGISPVISTLGNSNFAGTYLAMSLPFYIALWIREPRYRRHLVWMIGLVSVVCVATLSRAAVVAAVAGLLVIIGFVLASRWPIARWLGLAAAGMAAAGLFSIVVYRMIEPGSGSIAYRSNWWGAALEMGVSAPVIGHGPAAFALEGIRWRPLSDALTFGYGFADDPHSVILSLFTAGGALAVLGFLFLLGWTVRRGLPGAHDVLTAAFLASALTYFVNSTATIDDLSIRVALWGALGGLATSTVPVQEGRRKGSSATARSRSRTSVPKKKRRRSRPLVATPRLIAAVVVSLGLFVWSSQLLVADARVREGERLFLVGRVDEARTKFGRAIGFRDEYAYRHLYGLYLGQKAVEDPPRGEELIEEMDNAFAFVDAVPYVPAIADYARKLYEWGETDPDAYERALLLYERAASVDPLNPVLAVDTADVLIALERYDQAEELLVSFLELEDDRAELHGALSLVYFHSGRLQQAKDAAARALELNGSEARALETQELIED